MAGVGDAATGRLLFDVNVLIALFDPSHMDHVRARVWAQGKSPLRWASCPMTQNGFVRICAQPAYRAPVTMGVAIERITEAINTTDHVLWPDDVSLLDPTVFRHRHLVGHRQIADAYLLALAIKNGGQLATFDRNVPIGAVVGATEAHVARPGE